MAKDGQFAMKLLSQYKLHVNDKCAKIQAEEAYTKKTTHKSLDVWNCEKQFKSLLGMFMLKSMDNYLMVWNCPHNTIPK